MHEMLGPIIFACALTTLFGLAVYNRRRYPYMFFDFPAAFKRVTNVFYNLKPAFKRIAEAGITMQDALRSFGDAFCGEKRVPDQRTLTQVTKRRDENVKIQKDRA